MRIEDQERSMAADLLSFNDPAHGSNRLSRRRFLVGAAAAGMTALGATDEVGAQANREPSDWRHAALTQGEGNTWLVSCVGKGKTCAVLRMVTAKRLTAFHNAALATCTLELNVIFEELKARNTVSSRHPGLLVTPYAPFLVWMRALPDRVSRMVTLESDPNQFYQELGLSMGTYRAKPSRFWYSIGGGAIACRKGGETQLIGRLLTAGRRSSIHDEELAEYTDRINKVLEGYDKNNRNASVHVSILVTPSGLFLAWSSDDDRDGPVPRGAITAADPDERVFAALGI